MVAKGCAVVMVERVGANEGNVVVLTPQGEYRRLNTCKLTKLVEVQWCG
jgi:hypothetical protein